VAVGVTVVPLAPVPSPTAEPIPLKVHCGADLKLSVSSDEVTVASGGVPLLVSSDAPAGAYLNYGIGGDEVPAEPTTWTVGVAPGEMPLSCSTLEEVGPEVVVTVVAPEGAMYPQTLDELGCPIGGIPSWAVPSGEGATPDEAVTALLANFNAHRDDEAFTRAEQAAVGYVGSLTQTWILGTADETRVQAIVNVGPNGSVAWPDKMCVPSPWVDAS